MVTTDREPGDLVEIVNARQIDRLTPADYKPLTAVRDHDSRQAEIYKAAEYQITRVAQLREETVARLVAEGNYALLHASDLPFITAQREKYEAAFANSQFAVEHCPASGINDPDPFG